MPEPTGFETLERIIEIEYALVTQGTLSINSGRGDGIYDNLVIRTGGPNSKPVITGSSLKGVLRSTLEAILANAEGEGKICVPDTCVPRNESPPAGRKKSCGGKEDACSICQIFGNTGMRGRAIFHDARSNQDTVPVMSRTHVALTRDTGIAASQALMTTETVCSGVTFEGKITLINPCKWMIGAFLDTLPLLENVGMGAKKTSGYGDVKVEQDSLKVKCIFPKNGDFKAEEYRKACLEKWQQKSQPEVGG